MASQHPDIEKVLFTQEDIDGIVSRLGEQILATTRVRIWC